MEQTFTLKQKFRQFFHILFPILVTQLALYSMIFFDTVMSGQASSIDLAGVAIGSNIWAPVSTGVGGILIAITPIVGHLLGSNQKEQVIHKVVQGVYLALTLTFVLLLIGFLSIESILYRMDLEAEVRYIAYGFLKAISFGAPAYFAYQALRSFIDALGKTRITMVITLTSLPINVLLCYVFIFGKFGVPAFGGIGAGMASAITYYILLLIAISLIIWHPAFREYLAYFKFQLPSLTTFGELLRLGVPTGSAIFFETGIFAAVALLMSSFSTITLAAHQGAMNFVSLLYMIPLSFSMALTIVVGFEVGAKRFKDVKQYTFMGLGCAIAFALFNALLIYIFREQVATLYSKEEPVIELIQQFLVFAIFFQLSDAITTPVQGVLRGYKDVNVPFFTALFSYWCFGLPLGYYLAHYTSWGAFGFWLGLITGLSANAIFLLIRLKIIEKRYAVQSLKEINSIE